jgi:hypothetical protein
LGSLPRRGACHNESIFFDCWLIEQVNAGCGVWPWKSNIPEGRYWFALLLENVSIKRQLEPISRVGLPVSAILSLDNNQAAVGQPVKPI